jgi:hypothetical protein
MSEAGRLWFAAGPPLPDANHTSRMTHRQAIVDGCGWALVQAQLRPQHLDSAELAVFPTAILHNIAYSFAETGLALPAELRAEAFEPGMRAEPYFDAGGPCLIEIDDLTVLGWTRRHAAYESFALLHQNQWVIAFLPHGEQRGLIGQ